MIHGTLSLRSREVPAVLAVVRLGSVTPEDAALSKSVAECHERWGMWGFSVLEVPDGNYGHLARLRPIVAIRRRLLVASGPELIAAGFPLIPTLDHPHWTVVLSEPSTAQFARVRLLFHGPRADNSSFDPAPGDQILVGDDEEASLQARVVHRDGDRVTVQVELTGASAVA